MNAPTIESETIDLFGKFMKINDDFRKLIIRARLRDVIKSDAPKCVWNLQEK